ncbi:MAG: DNA polymerase III subunit delta' [Magnetococcales bacterium]|nr:DNA polymerase III subunit delta' [Magnetococcales bacterium]
MSGTGFDAIAGHREAIVRLQGYLAAGHVPHALLFSGPTGIGKATVIQAFVAALFCQQYAGKVSPVVRSACGACTPCRKIAGEHHPDLVRVALLPEKTRIAVEQIRDVCAFLALTPLEAELKVAIVDDAALMNETAANALLKTLEEPPASSLLILNTSRPGSLLPTIRSRCQAVRFFPLQPEELSQVAARNLAEVDPEALKEAIELAEGSAHRLCQLCTGDLKELKQRFRDDMEQLPRRHLADLCVMAGYWGDRERFPFAQTFLMAWFRDTIRATLPRWRAGSPEARVLDLARQSREMFLRVEEFNLNRQMALEALLIHLARWQGAPF